MARARKGGRRIKRKTQKETDTAQKATDLDPRAFVFPKGKVPAALKALVEDLKRMMSPNTARALRAQKRNKLRDFVDVAGTLHVGFFLIVSATDKNSYLRIARAPQGPTLTFRITGYSLSGDIAASIRKPYSPGNAIWQAAPTLVLSNFDKGVQHQTLAATMLRNLFPTLNVATAKLATFRRVVLVHQLPEDEGGGAELRQYVIKAAPTGVSRGVKKLVRGAKLPSLGRYVDVSDFLLKGGAGGYSSESGAETDDEDKAELSQDYVGRNAHKNQKVSIKLHEVGPRLSLKLLKVEEGLCAGATLYHSLVSKSEGEVADTEAKLAARSALKAERQRVQRENVDKKKASAAAKKKRRRGAAREDADDADDGANDANGEHEMTDADWYRQETGEEAPPELGLRGSQKKRARA
jgi:ribosome biogenesis protein SSF1/2